MRIPIILFLTIFSMSAFSKAGAPIPEPLISYTEAYKLAHTALLTNTQNIDPVNWPAEEYILGNMSYQKLNDLWVWKITFIHPIANDHSVSYYVNQMGKVIHHASTT